MPLLSVETNALVSEEQQRSFIKAASQTVAEILGKPESYVMVKLTQNQNMLFAGNDDALAHLKLKSLGLPEDKTQQYSASLCEIVNQHLNVNTDRIYIEFSNPPRHMWGWNKTTF